MQEMTKIEKLAIGNSMDKTCLGKYQHQSKDKVKAILEKEGFAKFISYGFSWSRTPEGYDFWYNPTGEY